MATNSFKYFTNVDEWPDYTKRTPSEIEFELYHTLRFTDKSHPLYKNYHFLLAYRFKNSVGYVKTAYLDEVFEKLYKPKSGSSEDVHDYYYVFIKILKQYINSIHYNKYAEDIRVFYGDVITYYFKNNKFNNLSSIRRSQVMDIYYYIFNKFNEFIDNQKVEYIKPINKMYKSKFVHDEVVEAAKRKKWIKNNQEFIKSVYLPTSEELKTNRGRPRKNYVVVHHPDLYGFP